MPRVTFLSLVSGTFAKHRRCLGNSFAGNIKCRSAQFFSLSSSSPSLAVSAVWVVALFDGTGYYGGGGIGLLLIIVVLLVATGRI